MNPKAKTVSKIGFVVPGGNRACKLCEAKPAKLWQVEHPSFQPGLYCEPCVQQMELNLKRVGDDGTVDAILSHPTLTDNEKAILVVLAESREGPFKLSTLSLTSISRQLGLSTGCVRDTVMRLEKKGVLDIHKQTRADGSRVPNSYEVLLTPKREQWA